jgi:hypothetical protein
MTAAELQARLAQPYDRASWLDTLGKTLPRTEIFAAPLPVPADATRAESIVQLGKVHLAGQRNLALLEVTVGDRVDLLRNRVGLRQLVARYIDQAEYTASLPSSTSATPKITASPSPPAKPPWTQLASLCATKPRRAGTPITII